MHAWPDALVLVAVIVGVDLVFLRHPVVARLIVNIGLVAVFVALYFLPRKRAPRCSAHRR